MKLIAVLIVLVGIPAALFANWVNFPIGRGLEGIRFSFLGWSPNHPHSFFFSYGLLSAVLLGASGAGLWRGTAKPLCWFALSLELLSVIALLQVSLANPALLHRLAVEEGQKRQATDFEARFIAPEPIREPSDEPEHRFVTVWDRICSGWYFLGLAWYVVVIIGFVVLYDGLRGASSASEQWRFVSLGTAAIVAVAVGIVLKPCLGQIALTRGYEAEARGDSDTAIRSYRRALRFDGWNRLNTDLYGRIGQIHESLGVTSTLEYRVHHAEFLAYQSDLYSAATEMEQAANSAQSLAPVLRARAAQLRTDYGSLLYQTAAFGQAVESWEKALANDPSDWLVVFYLARGYYAVGRYEEASKMIRECLSRVRDPLFLSNLYSDLGDAYMRQGRFAQAHLAYWSSFQWGYLTNRRALGALVAP